MHVYAYISGIGGEGSRASPSCLAQNMVPAGAEGEAAAAGQKRGPESMEVDTADEKVSWTQAAGTACYSSGCNATAIEGLMQDEWAEKYPALLRLAAQQL